MTILRLQREYPHLFAPQTWYAGESFIERRLLHPLPGIPARVAPVGDLLASVACPWAVELVDLFVRFPNAPMWERFLWCADTDQWGQRIFVGGLRMSRGFAGTGLFQIHRWVRPTADWGVPLWD